VLDYQAHIFQVPYARFRMSKPEALGIFANQSGCVVNEVRGRRGRRRRFVKFLRISSHD
jgi:hypothetical protein